jgi:hypothetical protein
MEKILYKKYSGSICDFYKQTKFSAVFHWLMFFIGASVLLTGATALGCLCSSVIWPQHYKIGIILCGISSIVCAIGATQSVSNALQKSKEYINDRADFLSELQDLLPKIFSIEDDLKELRYKYFIVYFIDSFRCCDLHTGQESPIQAFGAILKDCIKEALLPLGRHVSSKETLELT